MAPTRKSKFTSAIPWIVIVLLVGAATFFGPRFFRTDFRKALARQLRVEPEFLHLNIPPAPSRGPGAAFILRPLRLLLEPLDREQMQQGATFTMDWNALEERDAQTQLGAGLWRGVFSGETDDKISLRLTDARVIEAVESKLKERLLASEDVRRHANRGGKPLVIIRAYEGTIEMRVRRGGKSHADAWARKLNLAKELGGGSADAKLRVIESNTEEMIIQWTEPVIFAYEAAEAALVTGHLGPKANDVVLTPVKESAVRSAAAKTDASADDQKKND